MTLTELRYIVAVAREGHFGRAAEACFVSQPTLSVAIRKLEEELDVTLFERRPGGVTVTPIGEQIVQQAQRIMEETEVLRDIARQNRDELSQPLRLGVIYTIGPYLLPALIPVLRARAPQLMLSIEENLTARLTEMLHNGDLDVIVISRPFDEPGIEVVDLYDEPFKVVMPLGHPLAMKRQITQNELAGEAMLLLGTGHCLRDQVLATCPEAGAGQTSREGSSLETIRYMVATGAGLSILPATSLRPADDALLAVRPFAGTPPTRRVSLAFRRSFPRREAVRLLQEAILACELPEIERLKR